MTGTTAVSSVREILIANPHRAWRKISPHCSHDMDGNLFVFILPSKHHLFLFNSITLLELHLLQPSSQFLKSISTASFHRFHIQSPLIPNLLPQFPATTSSLISSSSLPQPNPTHFYHTLQSTTASSHNHNLFPRLLPQPPASHTSSLNSLVHTRGHQ